MLLHGALCCVLTLKGKATHTTAPQHTASAISKLDLLLRVLLLLPCSTTAMHPSQHFTASLQLLVVPLLLL
jgi:hypothetical protein